MSSEAFRGEIYQKVDSKARVSIPAAFRRILEADDPASDEFPRTRVTMIYGGGNRKFVECYSQSGAQQLNAMVKRLPPGSKQRLRAELQLVTRSLAVEIDEDGRIVLPPKVREKMGIAPDDLAAGLEAAFAGTLDRFQLWKRDTYDVEMGARADADDQDDDGADILALLSNLDPGI